MNRYRLWIITSLLILLIICIGIYFYSYIPVSKTNIPISETASKQQQDIYLLTGRDYLYAGKNKEAEEAFKRVLSINPRNVKALSSLGTLYFRQGNMELARNYWKEALNLSPDDAIIRGLLNSIAQNSANPDTLYHMGTKTAEQEEEWEKHFNDGQELYKKGDFQKAVNELKKARELRPDDSKIYFVLGASYLKLKDRENTIKMWELALKLNPDDRMIKELLGKLKSRGSISSDVEKSIK